MTTPTSGSDTEKQRDEVLERDWAVPRPVVIPEPTYTPMIVALGVMIVGWGLMAGLGLSVVGAFLGLYGLGGWLWRIANGR